MMIALLVIYGMFKWDRLRQVGVHSLPSHLHQQSSYVALEWKVIFSHWYIDRLSYTIL